MQRTPRSEAVRPTRRAISPRLAMRTDVIGVILGVEAVEERARTVLAERRDRAIARDLEEGIIDLGATWVNCTLLTSSVRISFSVSSQYRMNIIQKREEGFLTFGCGGSRWLKFREIDRVQPTEPVDAGCVGSLIRSCPLFAFFRRHRA